MLLIFVIILAVSLFIFAAIPNYAAFSKKEITKDRLERKICAGAGLFFTLIVIVLFNVGDDKSQIVTVQEEKSLKEINLETVSENKIFGYSNFVGNRTYYNVLVKRDDGGVVSQQLHAPNVVIFDSNSSKYESPTLVEVTTSYLPVISEWIRPTMKPSNTIVYNLYVPEGSVIENYKSSLVR